MVGLALFGLPGLLLALVVPADAFTRMWGAPKYVGLPHLGLALVSLLALGGGMVWERTVAEGRRRRARLVRADLAVRAFRVLCRVALVGYLAWAAIGIARGVRLDDIEALLAGAPMAATELKNLLAPVGGVTTLTQVVPLAATLAGMLVSSGRGRVVRWPLAWLTVLTVLRAYLASERLAILELVLPFVLGYLLTARPRPVRWRRPLTVLLPVAYAVAALALFSVFEYSRSWAFYREVRDTSYLDFAVERFAGYYTTSPNNGALLLELRPEVQPAPVSAEWLDQLPVLGESLNLFGDRVPTTDLLVNGANPEFNTEGALLTLAIDWGIPASLVLWAATGAGLGFVYRRVRTGDMAYLPLFATTFVGIVESGRYFYWGYGRAVVPIVGGVILARYLSRRAEPLVTPSSAGSGRALSAGPVAGRSGTEVLRSRFPTEDVAQRADATFRGPAVAVGVGHPPHPFSSDEIRQQLRDFFDDGSGVRPDQPGDAGFDSLGSLRGIPHDQDRAPQ